MEYNRITEYNKIYNRIEQNRTRLNISEYKII